MYTLRQFLHNFSKIKARDTTVTDVYTKFGGDEQCSAGTSQPYMYMFSLSSTFLRKYCFYRATLRRARL